MSSLPRDYHFLKNEMYRDSYVKFLMYGNMKTEIPQNIKIYNKVGDAYGYLIDCAYIEDTDAAGIVYEHHLIEARLRIYGEHDTA